MKGILSFILILSFLLPVIPMSAKKVKHNLKVETTQKGKSASDKGIHKGKEIKVTEGNDVAENLMKDCSFSGYEKEVNANNESFLLVNNSKDKITGFKIKIDYLDMQGRMLHSREIEKGCEVPNGETRKIDVPSWDAQHTYYYYLGNEPRRVATPYQVRIQPLTFWIEE